MAAAVAEPPGAPLEHSPAAAAAEGSEGSGEEAAPLPSVPPAGEGAKHNVPEPAAALAAPVPWGPCAPPEAFFEGYLRVVMQLVTGQDWEAWRAAWGIHLRADFASLHPTGALVPGDDPLLTEWRMALHVGQYQTFWLADLSLEEGPASVDCCATLARRYACRGGGEVTRELLRLRATAARGIGGVLQVVRHAYCAVPSPRVGGVEARSQIGQDLWVLQRLQGVKSGFFLEVGANHAEELSNSYLLEKGAGWRGLCLEPFPCGDWAQRSAELVKVAVGPDGGKSQFVAPGHVLGGTVGHVDLQRVARDVPQEQQQVVEVATRTMATILKEARPGGEEVPKVIHYMSLDTEGSEYEILCGFPWEAYTLLAITVEHNYREPARSDIRRLLESKGLLLDASVEHDDYFLLEGYEKHCSPAPSSSSSS